MDIPALISLIAHMLGGMIEVLRIVKFRKVSVDSFEGSAHSRSLEKGWFI